MYEDNDDDDDDIPFPPDTLIVLCPGENPGQLVLEDRIFVSGAIECANYIERFNEFITRLKIEYQSTTRALVEEIHRSIAFNCHTKLVELQLEKWTEDLPISSFVRSFDNVAKLEIAYSDWTDEFEHIPRYFPNVTHFVLTYVNADSHAAFFQELERLEVTVGLEIETVAALWQVNDGLRHLDININGPNQMSVDSLLNSIANNQSIVTLITRSRNTVRINDAEIERLHREHRTLNNLHLPRIQFSFGQTLKILDEFEFLQTFEYQSLRPDDRLAINEEIDGTEWEDISSENFWMYHTILLRRRPN